jgi:hypothetical protein
MTYICPTDHEKREWSRMAQAAYSAGRNDIGHRYSCAASMPNGAQTSVKTFDALQAGYRAWLIDNTLPAEQTAPQPMRQFDGTPIFAKVNGLEI